MDESKARTNNTNIFGEYCLVKTRAEVKRLLLANILFIEQSGRKLYFHTVHDVKDIVMYEKLSYAIPYLNDNFIVVGKAALNASHIHSVSAGGAVRFFNGSVYNLSAKQCGSFRREYVRLSEERRKKVL
ncbi:MAG: hypothetical protein IJU59_02565 [Firmicutes bacterium]|nr:hypothetical protein [Bacillota bacterium]